MIEVHNLSVRYDRAPVLHNLTLTISEGEMTLIVGPTGSGKTTLLRALAAQVPHLTGGRLSGRILVSGHDTREHQPRDLAGIIGYVAQDPHLSFVTDTVEEELAFTLEQLGVAPELMRRRIEDVLDLLSIEHLRHRSLHTLSGGEAQRVAIGAVLTAQPRILILDEPTSALDPVAAEEVLAALSRLVLDSGLTIILAEHRLERVAQFADQVVALQPAPSGGMAAVAGSPATIFGVSEIRPPVAELGVLLGITPPPVTVREARRAVRGLRPASPPPPSSHSPGAAAIQTESLTITYGDHVAVAGVSLTINSGEILAVMGRNGAGKSSLLWALAGALVPTRGRVNGSAQVVLVPQSPEDLLFRLTVRGELEAAAAVAGSAAGLAKAHALLEQISPGIDLATNPRDLSEGQRLALALTVQLLREPAVVALDEPTRGLDYPAKDRLAQIVRKLRDSGAAIVVASHDVEFLALIADRVVQLSGGTIVADGPARALLTDSAFSAPQMARVFAPVALLTVAEAHQALGSAYR